jgi:hypothetical protein
MKTTASLIVHQLLHKTIRPINTSTELPRKVAIPKEIQVVHGVYTPALINRRFCFRIISLTEVIENVIFVSSK